MPPCTQNLQSLLNHDEADSGACPRIIYTQGRVSEGAARRVEAEKQVSLEVFGKLPAYVHLHRNVSAFINRVMIWSNLFVELGRKQSKEASRQ
ncbi:hypothetical protein Fmac_017944 [Flemingia macrophylla]|uniref:Uncharacterized protein n=1 Tax=Flemingia macrophylla TaxID=520843 RepID=A0ABD1M496_9FABA